MTSGAVLANSPRQPQHENQHFRHRLVELGRNLVAEFDVRQRAGQHFVLLNRDVVSLGDLDDLLTDGSPALGDNPRRAGSIAVQRDRELAFGRPAHSARSRKCPARAAVAGAGGAPSRTTISPGCNSARLSAWLSWATPARNWSAVAGLSAHIRTEVRSPLSDICA